ncbi:MAG: DegV family protein [Bacillota bacterium]|nr:DegV family protein [Bacillota bacterium]
MSIQIITDSASDIVNSDREDITVLPMTITFNGTEYLDGINLSHREFYEKLIENQELPTTSQITPFAFEEAIRQAVEKGKDALIITMSSKLSGTYQSACIAALEFPEKVHVVDSENVTIGEHVLVEYALTLAGQGMDAASIAAKLDEVKKNIRLIALLDTLEYLKKGGRIGKATALAGSILSIKPVIAIEEGEVAFLGQARGSRQGNNFLAQRVKECGIDFHMPHLLGYTGLSDALLQKYINDSTDLWKDELDSLAVSTVGGTIGTHVGPGAIAVAFFAQNK